MLISTPNEAVPSTAYALLSWQLDAWDKQVHPVYVREGVAIHRGRCGAYDGWVMPNESLSPTDGMICSAYIHGWLNGRDSKP